MAKITEEPEKGTFHDFQRDMEAEIDRLSLAQPAPADLQGTPAEGLDVADPAPLGRPERRNLVLVLLVSQAVQVVIVSVLIGVFFVAFGLLAVVPATVEAWIGSTGDELASFQLLGTDIVLTAQLLMVAGFLGGFSGLYFTVQAVTDGTYREEFFEELLEELRTTLAVRSAYRALVTT